MNTVVVASMCPWPIGIDRPLLTRSSRKGGLQVRQELRLPAVPKGGDPVLLEIEDHVQWERMLSDKPPISMTITADEIAADFVRATATTGPKMGPESGPAVWICAEGVPTEEEKEEYKRRMLTYFRELYEEAEEWDRARIQNIPNTPRPTQRHKEAAKYLGLNPVWMVGVTAQAEAQATAPCPFCTSKIPTAAVICPNCKQTLNAARVKELKEAYSGKPAELVGSR